MGKIRRFLIALAGKKYLEEQLKRRQGKCQRCGACCQLVFRCPFLEGKNKCLIYENRLAQCRAFPIDERCLKEVGNTCGFYFKEE
ncbi:MAG: hypothetical protein AB1797_13845 [bacterium]